MTKNNEVVFKYWLQKRGDMRTTNWHIKDPTFKDIYYLTLCGESMSLDVEVKWLIQRITTGRLQTIQI